ncbi:MAG: CotH kinase family protein [Prolixibacteraceae bacterium]
MRKYWIKIWLGISIVLLLNACYTEVTYTPEMFGKTSVLAFDNHKIYFDDECGLALCPVSDFSEYSPVIYFQEISGVSINGEILSNNESFSFGPINKETIVNLQVEFASNDIKDYQLKFTLLPTICIEHSNNTIPDEPKVAALFYLSDPCLNKTIVEFCGIERRGGSANGRPKSSFGFELNNSSELNDSKKIPLLNMDNEDDWILDGLYSDLSCARNRASFDLWGAIQQDALQQGKDVLPSTIKGQYVEVFINDRYNGVYTLSNRVDGELLGFDEDHKGYLYKCENWNQVSRFLEISDTIDDAMIWAGWEQKYPDTDEKATWKPLYDLVDFVVNTDDKEFSEKYSSYIKIDQFIDFFILVNIIKGYDNTGQNLMLACKEFGGAFYFCPWDMDATWGRDWDSQPKNEKGIVLFEIYNRFYSIDPDNFKYKLTARWLHLRESIVTSEILFQLFEKNIELLNISGSADREFERWPESIPDIDQEEEYIQQWISARLAYLDAYFSSFD